MAGLFWPLLGILAGAFVATQAAINAELARGLGLSVAAAAASFLSGAVILAIVTAAVTQAQGVSIGWRVPPLWLFIVGGALGAAFVTSGIILIPRMGAAATMAFIVAGQLMAGMLLDRIGFMGMAVREITLGRVSGAVMLLAGALLIRFH
ncbi:MAG TPA: DMT family transporter [Aquamicrobium sp.]|nr:DMT family transporter [Aquamicrobium sp.]